MLRKEFPRGYAFGCASNQCASCDALIANLETTADQFVIGVESGDTSTTVNASSFLVVVVIDDDHTMHGAACDEHVCKPFPPVCEFGVVWSCELNAVDSNIRANPG